MQHNQSHKIKKRALRTSPGEDSWFLPYSLSNSIGHIPEWLRTRLESSLHDKPGDNRKFFLCMVAPVAAWVGMVGL